MALETMGIHNHSWQEAQHASKIERVLRCTVPSSQFQASSWLVSQVVGSRDRKAASMHDLNSERFTLSPEVFAMRIETMLHSCCKRFVSEMCSTMAAKQFKTSCIHFRPARPMTAEFHWNISSKVLGTSMWCVWFLAFAACVVWCSWTFLASLSFRPVSISYLGPVSRLQNLESVSIIRLQRLLVITLLLGWSPT